jgi:AraC-like DNA-binding protein
MRGTPERTAEAALWHTDSPEEAVRLCSAVFYPHRIRPLRPAQKFTAQHRDFYFGPFTLGDIAYGADVRLEFDDLATSYHVGVPLAGHLVSRHRGTEVTATPQRGALFLPEGKVVVTEWPAETRQLAVKIDRSALDGALERQLGRPQAASIDFSASMDITRGPARSWARLLLALRRELGREDAVLRQPLVAAPLAESLLNGLLLSWEHPYREALTAAARPARPAAVSTAVDLIEAEPQLPFTTGYLAQLCNVSPRALQEGFQRHVGMPPMAYVRAVRLRRAYEDLRAADPMETTVASVAHRWGFTHLGRFSAAYASAWHELPRQTLRAAG